jgi:hypothetical protein
MGGFLMLLYVSKNNIVKIIERKNVINDYIILSLYLDYLKQILYNILI